MTPEGVAIIALDGVLAKRMNLLQRISGGSSTQLIERDIKSALADPAVRGILLVIDSPGGTVDGTQELAALVREGAEQKPIVAWSDGLVGSAAYWIASAAPQLFISGDVVQAGSIGVVATHVDISKAEEQRGIKTTEIVAGRYKRIASQHAPLSVEGRQSAARSGRLHLPDFRRRGRAPSRQESCPSAGRHGRGACVHRASGDCCRARRRDRVHGKRDRRARRRAHRSARVKGVEVRRARRRCSACLASALRTFSVIATMHGFARASGAQWCNSFGAIAQGASAATRALAACFERRGISDTTTLVSGFGTPPYKELTEGFQDNERVWSAGDDAIQKFGKGQTDKTLLMVILKVDL